MAVGVREPAVPGREVVDPANWVGQDLEQDQSWIVELGDDDRNSLHALARKVRKIIGDDPNRLLSLSRSEFDFGSFAPRIDSIRSELKDGLGVVLLRGLSMDQIDPVDAAIIYWAIGQQLGVACSNNPEGDVFGHVTDTGKSHKDANTRGYQTREEMSFHADQCSIVGLLCVRTPREGGISKISSSVALYNEMLRRSPQSVELMQQPFCWTKHGEMDEGELGYYESPVFNFLDGMLCTSFSATHIRKGHDIPGVAPLTAAQNDAIELAKAILEEQHYGMRLQRGDIQLLNNSTVLHTRTEYLDWPEPDRKRLLWRLWLVDPAIRPSTPYINQWGAGVKRRGVAERIVI